MMRLDGIWNLRSWLLVAFFLLAGSASAGPCTTAESACTEWVTVAGGPSRLLVYRTYSPEARNDTITRALVMVHGQSRDADNYFRHALAGAFLANALEDTLVLAPRFASNFGTNCRDTLAPNELNWNCLQAPEGWRVGGPAIDNGKIAAFDAIDEILRKLARKEVFPNLRGIVVAGHSGGGQFVQRYQLTNRVHESLGVVITYVVANPSSYAYLDSLRPTQSAVPSDVAAASPGYIPPPPAKPPAPFVPFSDARNCTAYDEWPYGLTKRTGYVARLTDDELKKQLAARPTTYLLGELDILPLYGFDSSCSAGAQGPTRLARGLAYARYANEMHGAQHKTLVVAACGHSARCMFTAERALPVIFPKQ
jgi:pimeloyl-ACP methyl ester carboxylesterase